MKLILVSSPLEFESKGLLPKSEVSLVKEALAMGIEAFHLRKKSWGFEEVQTFLESFDEAERTKIAVHGSLEWPMMLELQRVHFKDSLKEIANQPDSFTESIQVMRRQMDGAILSRSFHSIDDMRLHSHKYDIAFLSPIFGSISKEGYESPFDLQELKTSIENLRLQHLNTLKETQEIESVDLYALGGIDESRIALAHELGFDGVAVLGCVWQDKNPLNKLQLLLDECAKFHPLDETSPC